MLIYLKPLSIFPNLHSDTLFGAITYAISELYPDEVDSMINEFENEPPFLLSSTFPFVFAGNNEAIRFFPKLILKSSDDDFEISVKDFKKYKKVEYLEEELFFKLINGEISEKEIISNLDVYHKEKNLLMIKDRKLNAGFSENIIPNNKINRLTSETKIFYTSGNEFENAGLFFLIKFYNKEYIPKVKAAMRFLRDRGFGKDISVGKGHFDYVVIDNYSIDNFLKDSDSMEYFITLSRYIPDIDKGELDIIKEDSNYEIDSKRGKGYNGDIRKQIRFFKEGSIFKGKNDFYGRLVPSSTVDSSPSYEYGFAFPLKCYGKGG